MCFEVGLCKRIILPFAVIRSVKKKEPYYNKYDSVYFLIE